MNTKCSDDLTSAPSKTSGQEHRHHKQHGYSCKARLEMSPFNPLLSVLDHTVLLNTVKNVLVKNETRASECVSFVVVCVLWCGFGEAS